MVEAPKSSPGLFYSVFKVLRSVCVGCDGVAKISGFVGARDGSVCCLDRGWVQAVVLDILLSCVFHRESAPPGAYVVRRWISETPDFVAPHSVF